MSATFTDLLEAWRRCDREDPALATVVRTKGSTYRQPGARMLIAPDGTTTGLLSGGCLEREIAVRAQAVLRQGRPELAHYDTRRLLGCHGELEILIERVDRSDERGFLPVAERCHHARQALVGSTVFAQQGSGGSHLGSFPVLTSEGEVFARAEWPGSFEGDGRLALQTEQPILRSYEYPGGEWATLLHAIAPPVRLLILGAGPDAIPLASFGAQLGWEVVVVAHPAQAAPAVPPRVHLRIAQADELQLSADARTAVVVMTHHFGRDLAYLARLLSQDFGYVGLLGPRPRRNALVIELLEAGCDLRPEKLHGPAGLDIGAEGPEEIACSIIAEIKAVLSGRGGGFLKNRKEPIHGGSSRLQT